MRDRLKINFSDVQIIKYEQKEDEWYSDAIRLFYVKAETNLSASIK